VLVLTLTLQTDGGGKNTTTIFIESITTGKQHI